MLKIYFALFFSVFSSIVFGQKWEKMTYQSFLKEYSNYLEQQPSSLFKVDIKTTIYQTISDAVPYTIQNAQLSVFENNNYQYSSAAAMQMQNDKFKLDIDTVEKKVMLSKRISSDLLGYKSNQFDKIDSSLYEFYSTTQANSRLFKVVEKKRVSSMQVVTFNFDKNNHRLNQMEMVYWSSNFMQTSMEDTSLERPKIILDLLLNSIHG